MPASTQTPPKDDQPSHLQETLADLIARQHPAGTLEPTLQTRADYQDYIRPRKGGR